MQAPPTWRDLIPLVAVVITIIGAILTGGSYIATVNDDGRRITALEQRAQVRDDQVNAIDMRTVRIETKLDLLKPQDVQK